MTAQNYRMALVVGGIMAAITPIAAFGQGTPPLKACFVPGSGTMYIVGQATAPAACRSPDHVMLQWSAATEPATLTGSKILTNFETVVFRRTLTFPDTQLAVFVVESCPAGKVALTGGFSASGGAYTEVVQAASIPQGSNSGSRSDWAFAFRSVKTAHGVPYAFTLTMDLFLSCATEL